MKTAETLATQHGVSEKTIRRDGKRAEALDKLAANSPQASTVGRSPAQSANGGAAIGCQLASIGRPTA